jgi:membrane associated rhomboid family serine protease
MVANSDRSLALNTIAGLPWFSVLFILLQLIVFASLQINDANASVFALQNVDDSALRLWAFDAGAPFRNGGLNIISSLFIHANANHLFANIIPALIFLSFAEKRFGPSKVILWLALGHIAALAGALIAHRTLAQSSLAAGMSGAILAVITTIFAARWKGHTGFVCIAVSGFYLMFDIPSAVTHLPPLACSYLFALFSNQKKDSGETAKSS